MTVYKLHKTLSALLEKGHARTTVCVNTASFDHPLMGDGAVILPVDGAEIEVHEMIDDDGGMATLANGQAKERMALVIYGDNKQPEVS